MPTTAHESQLLHRQVSDTGGQPAEPVVAFEREMFPWEKRCHATLECLNWRRVMSMEEKRRGISDLGQTIYAGLGYYEKWIMSATNHLLEHGHITQDELATRSAKIHARHAVSP